MVTDLGIGINIGMKTVILGMVTVQGTVTVQWVVNIIAMVGAVYWNLYI